MFDDTPIGTLPSDFAAGKNGNPGGGWTVIETATALSSPKVLAAGKVSQSIGHPTLVLVNQVIEEDFELTVSLLLKVNKSAGLLWTVQNERSYYLLQVSSAGQANITLYRVVKGVWTQLETTSTEHSFTPSQWHTLRVIVLDDRFVATFDEHPVLDIRDHTFAKGRFGLWSSGSGTTYFDNLHLKRIR
jgi:hypothetical protein